MAYKPQDSMWLWWLGQPSRAQLVGELFLADRNRKVAVQYDAAWLESGIALSEDLPLSPEFFVPSQNDTAAGAVDDARPDRWGERVIRILEKPERLSLLEFLYFAGDDRCGALGVSLSPDAYVAHATNPLPSFESLMDMQSVIEKVLRNELVPELHKRLLRPGASLGGARPKSLMQMDGGEWVVKFSDDPSIDTPMVEHATMLFSKQCAIAAAETRILPLGNTARHAVAVRRFDRVDGARLHVLSAKVALRAAGESMGYPQLAQLLRRLAPAHSYKSQQEELFRRMVFNILMENSDDHEQNHALVRQADGSYTLSAAFDVLPTMQGLGYQQMQVGVHGAESTLVNALSQANEFGLSKPVALGIVREIAQVIETSWKPFFAQVGVSARDIEAVAQYVDGNALRAQRNAFAAGGPHIKRTDLDESSPNY